MLAAYTCQLSKSVPLYRRWRLRDTNSGNGSLPGGTIYGAAAGLTDGGFGSFSNQLDSVFPLANGTANWPAIYDFAYLSIHEMAVLGQAFTRNSFNMGNGTSYFRTIRAAPKGAVKAGARSNVTAINLTGSLLVH